MQIQNCLSCEYCHEQFVFNWAPTFRSSLLANATYMYSKDSGFKSKPQFVKHNSVVVLLNGYKLCQNNIYSKYVKADSYLTPFNSFHILAFHLQNIQSVKKGGLKALMGYCIPLNKQKKIPVNTCPEINQCLLRYGRVNFWVGILGDQHLGLVVLPNRLTGAVYHCLFCE
jgi:hypothetical protein